MPVFVLFVVEAPLFRGPRYQDDVSLQEVPC